MKDILILQGKTFSMDVRWETEPIVYRTITNIEQSAPMRLTVPGHLALEGQRAAVTNVKGMTEINAEANAVRDSDYHPVSVVDSNTIEFNDVNAAGFKAYVSGGVLQYNTMIDLTGYTARMSIKDKKGGTELLSLTTENTRLTIDTATRAITIKISAAYTAAITWKKGVYDLEVVSPSGVVSLLLEGAVTVSREVTT